MIDRRRWPSPTRRSGETQTPAPSGPRCAMASRILAMYSSVMTDEAVPPSVTAPTMPHMLRQPSGAHALLCDDAMKGFAASPPRVQRRIAQALSRTLVGVLVEG